MLLSHLSARLRRNDATEPAPATAPGARPMRCVRQSLWSRPVPPAAPSPSVPPHQHGYRWAMLGGVWLIYFGFGLLSAGDGAAGRPHQPRSRPQLHDHGRHPGCVAAGLHRGGRALRGFRRPCRAQVVALPGRPHHHRIGRIARRRRRRGLDVRGGRAVRHRRAARLDRRAEGDRTMVSRVRSAASPWASTSRAPSSGTYSRWC